MKAHAKPNDLGVISGGVETTETSGEMHINVASDKAIINAGGFSLSEGNYLFLSGNSSELLTRVTGGEASFIAGETYSDLGLWILTNQDGIEITDTGFLSARDLISSAGQITDADLLKGEYILDRLNGTGRGAVINRGGIEIRDMGFVSRPGP